MKTLGYNELSDAPSGAPLFSATINDEVVADPKATRSILALMNLAAVNGGAACHWGGPSALVEMMTALHTKMFAHANWYEHFNFINDVGHGENGIYALRTNLGFDNLSLDAALGFRSASSALTGHGENHLYPEGVLLSNGPLGSSLGQAQGMAMGDKLAKNNRRTVCVVSDGACMEGEAKEAFSAIAGLAKRGCLNPFTLILSDNNTKLSGRIDEDSFSMTPSIDAFEVLGWEVIKVENGHDLKACFDALEKSFASKNPTLIHLKTIKGYPIKKTMESASGGHGFPVKPYSDEINSFLKEIYEGEQIPQEFTRIAEQLTKAPVAKASSPIKKEKMQAGFSRACIEAAKAGCPIVSVSSDLQGSTGMAAFHKEFPAQSFDVGIAESNMVSAAAGLSKAGFIPVVDTFAAFGVTKGNLPHIMASLSNCPVIAAYTHTGFQDAADGASHQSTTYISAVSSIPYTQVHVVSSSEEAEQLMKQAIKAIEDDKASKRQSCSHLFFAGRENFATQLAKELTYQLGRPQILSQGSKGVIVACGPMVGKAMNVANKLGDITVINNSCVNSFDASFWEKILSKHQKFITIEDHQKIGGMGEQLIAKLSSIAPIKATVMGVQSNFGRSAYTADELYKLNALSEDDLEREFNAL